MLLADRALPEDAWWLIIGPPLVVIVALVSLVACKLVSRCKACGKLIPPETETCPRCGEARISN
jgi:hypothetical protein